jgi:rod shape-determining protein MreC
MKLPQPEKSPTASGALIVLVVLALVVTTVWYREGDAGPIHRLRGGLQAASAPVGAAGEWVTRPIRGVLAWASDLGVSRSQLEALRKQNAELRTQVAQSEEARLENERLRALVGFVQTNSLQAVGARVIGRPTNSWERVITIDRGSLDGVTTAMPVLGSRGLLGQTIEVTSHTARVRLITDPKSGVAAMIQANRGEGIVRGSLEGDVTFDFVSRETTVRAGDVVVTSGMGGVYPKGLLVGEVTTVVNTPASLYQEIEIMPTANLSGLEEVVVLVGTAPKTQIGGGE